jgi:hypothetical protein
MWRRNPSPGASISISAFSDSITRRMPGDVGADMGTPLDDNALAHRHSELGIAIAVGPREDVSVCPKRPRSVAQTRADVAADESKEAR